MTGSSLQQARRSNNPRTLRDLLNETSSMSSPSPSTAFKPIPRKPIPSTTMRSLIEMDINSSSSSRRNSNPRILNSLLNSLAKKFHSFAQNHPSILPRSVSRKLSRKTNSAGNCRGSAEIKVPIRIKDIVRWKSFEDLDVENPQPLDFSSASSTCSSKGSSWSDSDFSSCDGNFGECPRNDVASWKRFLPLDGVDSVHATTGNPAGPKVDLSFERDEEEQMSPVSVLKIEEYEEYNYEFDDKYEGEDESEAMAWKLVKCAESSVIQNNLEKLLLDLFKEEVRKRRVDEITEKDEDEVENEILRRAQDWINGSFGDDFEHSNKNACVRDMDEGERWNKFEDEREELACEIEGDLLENLIFEIFSGSFPW